VKIALSPVDVVLGDWEGNLQLHYARVEEAAAQGAELVVFPELSLVGYSPRDLLARPSWSQKAQAQLNTFHSWLQKKFPALAVIVGTTIPVDPSHYNPRGLANGAVFLQGSRRELRAKTLLPDYDVFQESRYFDSAAFLDEAFRAPIEFRGHKLGILICEDSWQEMEIRGRRLYRISPTERLQQAGADFLINLSASPFDRQKRERRRQAITADCRKFGLPLAYVNHFGAQDEILFDGDCFFSDARGEIARGKVKPGPGLLFVDTESPSRGEAPPADSELAALEFMLVTGIRDYCRKNGFARAVLGISGGIDSALVAALAVAALGPENVIGLVMPSKFSSQHSIEDAEALAAASGLRKHHFPIKMPHSTLQMALNPFFAGMGEDVTEENLQSRIRGLTVMAFANKFRALGLATGNKSEFAMGYTTIYGDMCGALAPIGDLYKTEVYELARFLNRRRPWIPERTFTKPPSAELRPGQVDQDSLPPYELLDKALRLLVDQEMEADDATLDVLKKSHPEADLALLLRLQRSVRLAEYKRKQAPPILKVSQKAFGMGRLYPVTCSY
jgi:NAD+ synthase (glutamine-hydrolysing)